ncbi:MAG TPA: hypothetical protein VMP01_24655 [Pirellulaceae bacterium]|nr:hypothetical protein [Pirellulaceae bacterium]
MSEKRVPFLAVLGLAQLVVLLPIGLLDPMKFSDDGWFQRSHAIAIVLGCGFAQASVAAAWMALGPLQLRVRGPGSAAWVLLAATLLAINIAVNSPRSDEGVLLGASFVGVWLFVQAPLWLARGIYRLRLEPWTDSNPFAIVGEHQFGIRQLLVVTAAVAMSLGFGRLMILGFSPNQRLLAFGGPHVEMIVIVGLFIICNSLVAFTVITGALLPRHWLFAVALGCCAASVITLAEWNLFAKLVGGPGKWQSLLIIGGMNGLQFCWLLLNLLAVRLAGYRLMSR